MRTILGRCVATVVLVAFAAACGGAPKPRSVAGNAPTEPKLPIGEEYTLVPGPSDDDSILGRIVVSAPQPGESLANLIQPNPCSDKLEPAKTFAMSDSYEDAEELAVGAKAGATLGLFGFAADVNHATHFLYKLSPQKKVIRADTTEYAECCAEKGGNACGFGYVQSIVYGDGEYSTGEETTASGGVDIVAVGSASGTVALKVLHRKKVHGYFAIGVHPRDPSKKDELGPLGVAKAAGITETSASEQVKATFEPEKIVLVSEGERWHFADQRSELTENEFVRRYRAVTGSHDLDDVESHRSMGFAAVGLGIFVVFGAVALYGGTHLKRDCTADESGCPESGRKFSDAGFIMLVAGSAVGLVGLIIGITGLASSEGAIWDHALTEYDGRLYVEKYNRKLLRKTIKDVESSQKTTWLKPKLDGGPMAGGGGYLALSFAF